MSRSKYSDVCHNYYGVLLKITVSAIEALIPHAIKLAPNISHSDV